MLLHNVGITYYMQMQDSYLVPSIIQIIILFNTEIPSVQTRT